MSMSLFWGILILLIGVSIIVNVVFHLNIPIFKVFFGLLFILIGLNILFGRCQPMRCNMDPNTVFFHNRTFSGAAAAGKEYNAIFGQTVIDLTQTPLKEVKTTVQVNAVFGKGEVYISRDMPVKIQADAAFGQVTMPDGNIVGGFGTTYFRSAGLDEGKPHLVIITAGVFGALEIKYK